MATITEQELINRLAQVKLLAALTYPALRRVAREGRVVEVKEGQMIIGPKLGPTSAYVVLEGSITVVMPWGPVLAYLGPGEVFGEMSLVEQVERSAFCKAYVDSLVFEIPFQSFHTNLMANPVVRAGLEEISLARRAIQHAIRHGAPSPNPSPPEKPEPAAAGGSSEGAAATEEGAQEGAQSTALAQGSEPGAEPPKPPSFYATA